MIMGLFWIVSGSLMLLAYMANHDKGELLIAAVLFFLLAEFCRYKVIFEEHLESSKTVESLLCELMDREESE